MERVDECKEIMDRLYKESSDRLNHMRSFIDLYKHDEYNIENGLESELDFRDLIYLKIISNGMVRRLRERLDYMERCINEPYELEEDYE